MVAQDIRTSAVPESSAIAPERNIMMTDAILVLNAGSSSLKFPVFFDDARGAPRISRAGGPRPRPSRVTVPSVARQADRMSRYRLSGVAGDSGPLESRGVRLLTRP